ncbi:dextranase [Patella vulgata]|uniref:dextranase n=1 Tax=Patella vulgata TaxID=6465 RepID=UPI00217F2DAB|nr:dextranase [Patella vulgata]
MMATKTILALLVQFLIRQAFGNLNTYPAPRGIQASNKFRVYLSQGGQRQSSFTYITTSAQRATETPKTKGGRSVSWTSFSFSGSAVTAEIHTPHDFQNCIVRPQHYGYKCQRTGSKTAHVTISSTSRMMSVEFDYDYGSINVDIKDKMLIFADPPESNVPNEHDSSVLFYKAGVHNLNGQMHLNNNIKTIYLAPGAWVEGGFLTTANHRVTLRGRGILSTRSYKWRDEEFLWATLNFDKGDNHVVEGIVMVDPQRFFFRGLSGYNTIRNVKMIAPWAHNSDGVAIGRDGLVEDTFIWANDDSFKVYKDNMVVRRCVVWQAQNGAVFQFGWWKKRYAKKIRISDVDVIHTDWCTFKGRKCHLSTNNAIIDLGGNKTKSFNVSDIVFSNIRIEGSCPRLVYFKMNPSSTGSVTNMHFNNWSVESQTTHDHLHNEIQGANKAPISGWTFTNLKIGGHCISSPNQADFRLESHTNNIKFICH